VKFFPRAFLREKKHPNDPPFSGRFDGKAPPAFSAGILFSFFLKPRDKARSIIRETPEPKGRDPEIWS
jgi:hypothetical protein